MPVSLSHVLNSLGNQISSSQALIATVTGLGTPRFQVEIIGELAFLKIFMAWENFLEESFIRYLVGATSPSGYSPSRLVNPPTMEIARNLILGEHRKYVNWNSASQVVARAYIFFQNGDPYSAPLTGGTTDLDQMNIIRNRIAHKSNISKTKFAAFVRRTFGYGVPGMTPGRLLLSIKPGSPAVSFLDHYVGIINATSRIIVPI